MELERDMLLEETQIKEEKDRELRHRGIEPTAIPDLEPMEMDESAQKLGSIRVRGVQGEKADLRSAIIDGIFGEPANLEELAGRDLTDEQADQAMEAVLKRQEWVLTIRTKIRTKTNIILVLPFISSNREMQPHG
jgi:hypothetical protein